MKLNTRHRQQLVALIPDSVDVFGAGEASIAARMDEAPLARKYLIGLCHGWTRSRACLGAGVSFLKASQWRKSSATFAEIERMAEGVGADMIEEHAFRLAVEGLTTKSIDKDGKVTHSDPVYDRGMLEKLLAARKPDQFGTNRVKSTHDHTHRVVTSPGQSVLKMLEERAEKPVIEGDFKVVNGQPAA